MPNMNISLPAGGAGKRISVGDGNGLNSIPVAPTATAISWTLTGALARANFVVMTAAEPGFSWLDPIPTNLFSTPIITNDGDTLSFTDNHIDATTVGQWAYMLRVLYNGVVYTTTNVTGGLGGTINRPIIINR